MIELKPCPFCGSKPNVTYITNAIGNKIINIECDKSKCNIVLFTRTGFSSDDAVIEAWNRRADDVSEVTQDD